MMTKPYTLALLVATHGVTARKPSFIWFNPDEMRAESAYGEVPMPNLDRLTAGGVRFTQCHTSHTTCSQSRASFMTGWPTHVNGHRSLWSLVRDSEPNVFRYLHDDGYDVYWWGKNDNLEDTAMMHSTMHREAGNGGDHNGTKLFAFGDPRYYSFLYPPLDASHANKTQDWYNVNEAIEFLKKRTPSSPPFMIFLPLLLPHPPYSCPEPWHSMVDPATVQMHRPISTAADAKPDFHGYLRQFTHQDQLNASEAELLYRQVRATYLGCTAYSDSLLGLLLDALDATGLANETAVMHFADHGDYAGDWGLVEKWPSGVEDVLTRVPLVVRAPFVPSAVRGVEVGDVVQLFDIVATTLELASIKPEHVHFSRSLMPYMSASAKPAGFTPRAFVYTEGGYATNEPRDHEGWDGLPDEKDDYYYKELLEQDLPISVCRAVSVRNLTAKLVFRSDPKAPDHYSELYDLVADPFELSNKYADPAYAPLRAELKEEMLRWLVQTSDITPWSVCDRNSGKCDKTPFRRRRRRRQ